MKKIKEFIANIGRRVINILEFSGFTIILFLNSLYYLKRIFRRRHEIARQMYNAGVRTIIVLSVVSIFTGMVLALQTGIELRVFNLEENIGNVVVASLTREMGPFSAAIILIASIGSAMAAEIGTMKVSEEIDALEMMSISPVDYLVMPRLVALTLMLPIATVYVNTLGTIGGAIVAYSHLSISFDIFYQHVLESLWFKAVYVGLLKSFVFGIIISCVSCAHGLRATDGARGVGRATRKAVVASFLMVLIVGYYLTDLFFRGGL